MGIEQKNSKRALSLLQQRQNAEHNKLAKYDIYEFDNSHLADATKSLLKGWRLVTSRHTEQMRT